MRAGSGQGETQQAQNVEPVAGDGPRKEDVVLENEMFVG